MSARKRISRFKRLASVMVMFSAGMAAPAVASEKIVLDGSTGMLALARALADAYQRQFPNARVEVGAGLGTGARLKALADGRIHLALASHGVNPEDVRAGDLKVFEVARGAVVFAVNETVPITSATAQQVCDVYDGKLQTWRAMGGSDAAIVVLTRPAAEVDPEVVRAKLACFKDLKEVASARVMQRGGDMAKALSDTPHSLGMTSMTVVEQSGGKVKALSLDGVQPTAANVKSGRYGLTRDFLFVAKGEPAGPVRNFLDFLHGPEGERVILANGAVPVR
jgi:phosphate transport system substrate-binding protein